MFGEQKKKVIRLVAVAQVKMLAVLCCGRKQPLAPAAKLENIFYSSVLCFFPVCLFFFAGFFVFNAFVFFLVFFAVVLRCCFRWFFTFFSPFHCVLSVV